MVREIVFDTETTGFNYDKGDRLIEIGAVELINHIPTGKIYHQYINPERDVPEDAVKVHGLTYDFLKDYPTFDKVADDWLDFVGEDSILVAHNAQFDMSVLAKTINGYGIEWLPYVYYACTCQMAKECIAEAPDGKLRTLCQMFEVELLEHHNALADARACSELLLKYLERGIEPAKHLNNFDVFSQHTVKEKHACLNCQKKLCNYLN